MSLKVTVDHLAYHWFDVIFTRLLKNNSQLGTFINYSNNNNVVVLKSCSAFTIWYKQLAYSKSQALSPIILVLTSKQVQCAHNELVLFVDSE